MEDPGLEKVLDQLMADSFALNSFMLQTSLELARQQLDPKQWATTFISSLYARIDSNEERIGSDGRPIHELARQRFDTLGHQLHELLRIPPQ